MHSYVYGNLPMTIDPCRSGCNEQQPNVKMLGRQFSALADLFTILFLYLLVSRMYGRKVGLLASLFSALTVMQIQQSHFLYNRSIRQYICVFGDLLRG